MIATYSYENVIHDIITLSSERLNEVINLIIP